jgi:hypothetical protein
MKCIQYTNSGKGVKGEFEPAKEAGRSPVRGAKSG